MHPLNSSIGHSVTLPDWPLKTVRKLADNDIWLAGGPVRDLLMGRSPKDWDFVVDRHAIRLGRAVADAMSGAFYVLDADRGTGRAIVSAPQTHQPISLDFAEMRDTTLVEDLHNRDFTINAMALTLDGRLIDPTGGQQDLARGVIRLTHAGCLQQDPARLVRAARLATDLGFNLSPESEEQARTDAPLITQTSAERVRDELLKLFALDNAARGLQLLDELHLLRHILPEVAAHQDVATQRRIMAALIDITGIGARPQPSPAKMPPVNAEPLAAILDDFRTELAHYFSTPLDLGLTRRDLAPWCLLFLKEGTSTHTLCQHAATQADNRLTNLRFSRHTRTFIVTTIQELWRFGELVETQWNRHDLLQDHRRELYRYFRDTGESGVLIALLNLVQQQTAPSTSSAATAWKTAPHVLRAVLTTYFHLHNEIVDPEPHLTGKDLLQIGFTQGPELGAALEALREAQAAGDAKTLAEAKAWARQLALRDRSGEQSSR